MLGQSIPIFSCMGCCILTHFWFVRDDSKFIFVSLGHSDSDGAGDAIDPTLSPQVNNLANIFRMGWNHQLDDVYDNDDDVYDNDVDEVTLTIIDEILFGIEVFIEQSPLFFQVENLMWWPWPVQSQLMRRHHSGRVLVCCWPLGDVSRTTYQLLGEKLLSNSTWHADCWLNM